MINAPQAFIDYVKSSTFDYSSIRSWEIETLSQYLGDPKMTDPKILEICDKLSVSVDCYEKVRNHLRSVRHSLCHICFDPSPADYYNLRWVGDEHVPWCGKDECLEKICELDRLAGILEKI